MAGPIPSSSAATVSRVSAFDVTAFEVTASAERRDVQQLLDRAKSGNRVALGRLLSVADEPGDMADELDRLLMGPSLARVIGITGAPGTGKSTLTDQLVRVLRQSGHTVAVVAVDPSSSVSGGALLGDRLRMSDHDGDPGVLIRSVATRGASGGLADSVPATVRVLAAVGFDIIILETVGVGQIELEIAKLADTVVLVTNPGGGDEVQAVKAGILEIADVLVVNKADLDGVSQTETDLRGAMQHRAGRVAASQQAWVPPVIRAVALTGGGVKELAETFDAHRTWLAQSGVGPQRAHQRNETDLATRLNRAYQVMADKRRADPLFATLVQQMDEGRLSVGDALRALLSEGDSPLL